MKKERDSQQGDLAGRIKSLDQFTGTLVAPARSEDVVEVIPITESPVGRVPRPRRSRVFLRKGEGHGFFAELTVTAPPAHAAIE